MVSTAQMQFGNMYGGSGITWMCFNTSGQVLINETTAVSGAKLEVNGTIAMTGSTSGTLTLSAPATAGTNTITFPAGTTNFSTTGGSGQVVETSNIWWCIHCRKSISDHRFCLAFFPS